MEFSDSVLQYTEKVVLSLRSLLESWGYSQYKMSKFEEYDLYVRNKDFLISDSIITFTDTTGRLMALKPDVTLSIIKNGRDLPGAVQKMYYDENVYRVSDVSHTFREIRQIGAECIGDIGIYDICETVFLAAQSLRKIAEDSLLDISHLGLISAVFSAAGVPEELRHPLMTCIGEKNLQGLSRLCIQAGFTAAETELISKLVSICGRPDSILPMLDTEYGNIAAKEIEELRQVVKFLKDSGCGDLVSIDFSAVSDIKYYNGIVFRGFVNGIPACLLSGGQYDRLMKKMGRGSGAVGFAVYLDLLETYGERRSAYDTDVLILYDRETDPLLIRSIAETYIEQGLKVLAQRRAPEGLTYRTAVTIRNGEVLLNEDPA